jgi:bacterioferritin-associated ferredoxin
MIICVCKAVSDRQIRQAADRGVVALRELSQHLGVGTCCGKCVPLARSLLQERQARIEQRMEGLGGYGEVAPAGLSGPSLAL